MKTIRMLAFSRLYAKLFWLWWLVVLWGTFAPGTVASAASTGLYDDFESYAVGTFPGPAWTASGNAVAVIDNTTKAGGSKSLRLFGVVGDDWVLWFIEEFPCDHRSKSSFTSGTATSLSPGCTHFTEG